MSSTLRLEIITPVATVFSEDVEMVTLPAVEGEIGILPQHVPLMTQMVPGEMIVRQNGQDRFLAVGEGLVEITGDHVAILTDLALPAEKSTKRQPKKHGNGRRPAYARGCLTRKSPT